MKALRSILAGSATTLLTTGAALTGTAQASPGNAVSCGQSITHSTVLTNDVGPCPGNGLVIAASNVTLDLAGHRVYGTSPATATDAPGFAGITLQSVHGVTVVNGSVDHFNAGILISGSSGNSIKGINVHDNLGSLFGSTVETAAQYGDGILLAARNTSPSDNNLIEGNTVNHNGNFDGIGLVGTIQNPLSGTDIGVSGNRIIGNTIDNNNLPDICPPDPDEAPGAVDTDANANGNGDENPAGVDYCAPGQPSFNEDIGIRIEGPGATNNTIAGNQVNGSGLTGVLDSAVCDNMGTPSRSTSGCTGTRNTGNVIAGNTITHGGFGAGSFGGEGISLISFNFGPSGGTKGPQHTTVEANTVTDNNGGGILVAWGATSNNIRGNTALRNTRMV